MNHVPEVIDLMLRKRIETEGDLRSARTGEFVHWGGVRPSRNGLPPRGREP